MKRHLIFGAGQIGCYLGAVMQLQGWQVSLLARPAIRTNLAHGIQVSDLHQHSARCRSLQFIEHNDVAGKFDFIWLTVKCTDVAQAVEQLSEFVKPDTIIFCCQNGLDTHLSVVQKFPQSTVLRVVVPFNVVMQQDDHYHRGSEGHLTIEQPSHLKSLLAQLQTSLCCELLPVRLSGDIEAVLWAKLQLNLGNSVNALANVPVKAMLQQRHYRHVIAAMMDELLQVARKKQIEPAKLTAVSAWWIPRILKLPDSLFRLVANSMLQIDPTVKTSMWWDLQRGKMTEVDYLNGVLVRHGKEVGVDCPVNALITLSVKEVEKLPNAARQVYSIDAQTLYTAVKQRNS